MKNLNKLSRENMKSIKNWIAGRVYINSKWQPLVILHLQHAMRIWIHLILILPYLAAKEFAINIAIFKPEDLNKNSCRQTGGNLFINKKIIIEILSFLPPAGF